MKLTLRAYQAEGVDRLRDAYRQGYKKVLYVCPTGGGKTVVFTYIAQQASARRNHTWIIVHRQELLFQTSRALEALGVPHGVVAPGFTPSRDYVQVCSVQTLIRRIAKNQLGPCDLLVIDEAHHATAGSWRKVIDSRPDARILGVTATPQRGDGQGLGEMFGGVFDCLVNGPSIRWLIDNGYLCQPIIYAPDIPDIDMSGVKQRGGDWEKGETARRMDKPTITGCAVQHYKTICSGVPAIAFCSSVKHAENVAAQFRAAGYRSLSIDGTMHDAARARAIKDLGAGRIHVLTSCDIVSEGTDIPVVTCGMFLRPTKSVSLYMQQGGRVLRPAPGKDAAIILDFVGNCMQPGFGLLDAEREWSLAGKPKNERGKKESETKVKTIQCPKCYHVHVPAPRCALCGHVYSSSERKPKQVDGELAPINADQLQILREKKLARMEVGRAKTLQQLQAIAEARGYKPGWAEHIFRSRQNRRGYQ